MTARPPVRERDRDAILQSLRAGVVPRRGLQHIQVGRAKEVEVVLEDVIRIAAGGTGIRFIIGAFGSGKTFFLSLARAVAAEKRLVTAHADLNPDRRLHSTGGHARSLYAELMRNLATRSTPDGGALPSVVERFASSAIEEARTTGQQPDAVIRGRLHVLSELVGGYEFAHAVECYWRGHNDGDEDLKASAVRWLRAEYLTRTDARRALSVRGIIDDDSFYDNLKLLARFVRLAGYGGLLVCLDELVNLYKMANGRARNSNYEQILRILNDCLQGSVEGLGFLFGGTPEFLTDTRRGLYSYQALQSRLAENTFARGGMIDHQGPVVRLGSLTREDLYVLLVNLRHVHAGGDASRHQVPDAALRAFMEHCEQRVGEAYFRTPRNTIREFVHFLSTLEQNPQASWERLLSGVAVTEEPNPDLEPLPDDGDEDGAPADTRAPGNVGQEPGDGDDVHGDEFESFRL